MVWTGDGGVVGSTTLLSTPKHSTAGQATRCARQSKARQGKLGCGTTATRPLVREGTPNERRALAHWVARTGGKTKELGAEVAAQVCRRKQDKLLGELA